MNKLRFSTIIFMFLTYTLASSNEVHYKYAEVYNLFRIGFSSPNSCEFFHNKTGIQNLTSALSQDISISKCILTFRNISHLHAGSWKISSENRTENFYITVLNKIVTVYVRPNNVESSVNQTMTFHMPKINKKIKYCLLEYENEKMYNVTKNETDLFEPRYDCGVKMKIDSTKAGNWKFIQIMEENIMYTGNFKVKVIKSENQFQVESIYKMIGSKCILSLKYKAASCILTDNQGNRREMKEDMCSYTISSVTYQDSGNWTYHFHINNKYITYIQQFNLIVYEPQLETSVFYTNNTKIHLLCQVKLHYIVSRCYFEHPNGTLFIMNERIGGEKYESFTNISDEFSISDTRKYCGITIRSPNKFDYGTWRCSMKIDDFPHTFGKTIQVRTPEEKKYQVSTKNSHLYVRKTDSFELSCTVNDIIKKCWIISPTGTIYTVNDNMNEKIHSDLEYKGQSFSMGDCGAIIKNATVNYDGDWKCEMKLQNDKRVESRISVTVTESPIIAKQDKIIYTGSPITMSCYVIPDETFDFDVCRWIKPDGNGIYYESDQRYRLERNYRECNLVVTDTDVEGKWTCVVQSHIDRQEIYTITIQVYKECSNNLLTIIGSISLCLVFVVSCIILYLRMRRKKRQTSNNVELQ